MAGEEEGSRKLLLAVLVSSVHHHHTTVTSHQQPDLDRFRRNSAVLLCCWLGAHSSDTMPPLFTSHLSNIIIIIDIRYIMLHSVPECGFEVLKT